MTTKLGQLAQQLRALNEGNLDDPKVRAAFEWMTDNEKALQREASRLAGTSEWTSYHPSVGGAGAHPYVGLSLMANVTEGNIVTMDRYTIDIVFYPDATEARHQVSRTVRDLRHGQDRDKSRVSGFREETRVPPKSAKELLAPSKHFWKSVRGLKPDSDDSR